MSEINSDTKQLNVIGIMGTHIFPGKHANLGVSALCESVLKLSEIASPGVKIWLMDCHSSREPSVVLKPNGEELDVRLISWRLSLKSPWRKNLILITLASISYKLIPVRRVRRKIAGTFPWVDALEKVQFVGDIHGGDSFSDIYGFRRFFGAALAAWTVLLVNGNLVQLPQTYGPFKGQLARLIASYLIRRSSTVVARDKQSRKVAQSLAIESQDIQLSPDVAFVLSPEYPTEIKIGPDPNTELRKGLIGINVNGLMFNGGYSGVDMFGLKMNYREFLKKLVIQLLESQENDILLVPHTITPKGISESDNEGNEKLWEALPENFRKRVSYVQGVYDCHEIKSIIGTCDFFIGSRMHSCIAALSQGIPCVGVAYSMKFTGVFDSVGMKDWVVDAREFDEADAAKDILALYQERDRMRPILRSRVEEARGKLSEIFTGIFSSEIKGFRKIDK